LAQLFTQLPDWQTPGVQSWDRPWVHELNPAHSVQTRVFATQVEVTHSVPTGQVAQAPLLHTPVYPHVDAACSGQSPSGSVSALTLRQTPSSGPPVSADEQALQLPAHDVLQQRSSTQ
jgi:hypothetical protein